MYVEEGGWVGTWSPGIGDPTAMGWVTVGAYALTALASGAAAVRGRAGGERNTALFWGALAALYLALGVNKQLDLQSLMTELGRINAHAWGWYEHRWIVQVGLIAALVVLGCAGIVALAWTAPWRSGERSLALVGTVMLLVFVVARASSFNHLDRLIGTEWLGLRANWLLELPGIAMAGVGAAIAALRQSVQGAQSGS